MKRRSAIVGVILLILIIVCFIIIKLCFLNKSNNEILKMKYGDSFSQLNVKNHKSERKVFPESSKNYQIVFYLDMKCKTCIDQLETIRQLNGIFVGENVDVKILWQDEMDANLIKQYEISPSQNFILEKVKLESATPTFFLLNQENKVLFSTIDSKKLVKKYLELDGVSRAEIQLLTNKFIKKEAEHKLLDYDAKKPILVYFAMEGCADCKAAEPIVFSNDVKEKYNIFTVWDSQTIDSNEGIVDSGNALFNIYEIDWYPSFLKIDLNADTHLSIGETRIESLKEKLLE